MKLPTLFKTRKEDAGVVVSASSTIYGEYPDPSFKDLIEYYERDPIVRAAIDDLAERAVGMGFYTTSEKERAKRLVDEFCEEVGLDQLNLDAARHAFAFGNFIIEKVYDKYQAVKRDGFDIQEPAKDAVLIGLKPLPLSSFTRIFRDQYGNILAYAQQVGGQTIHLSPKILLHITYNIVDCSPTGLGLVKTLALPGKAFTRVEKTGEVTTIQRMSILNMKQEVESVLRDWFRRYIGRYAFIWKGETTEKVREYVAALKKLKENEDIGIGVTEGGDLAITPLSIDPRARFDAILDYIEMQLLSGLQTPIVKLFTTPGFTEASAKAAVELSERKVAAFQRYLKRKIEREVFRPVVEQNGLKWENNWVRLNWGMQETPKVEVNDILKLAEISAQYGVQYIRPEEVRKNLVKLGVELWEQEAK